MTLPQILKQPDHIALADEPASNIMTWRLTSSKGGDRGRPAFGTGMAKNAFSARFGGSPKRRAAGGVNN